MLYLANNFFGQDPVIYLVKTKVIPFPLADFLEEEVRMIGGISIQTLSLSRREKEGGRREEGGNRRT